MALSWGFLVALSAILAGFAEAQNATSTVTTPAATTAAATTAAATTSAPVGSVTPTNQIVATATVSVAPVSASTVPSSSGFHTYLNVTFMTSSGCDEAKEDLLNSMFKNFFSDVLLFDLIDTAYSVRNRKECKYGIIFTFGPNLKRYNISDVFEDKLKSMNYTIGSLKLSEITTDVYVPDVKLGEYKVTTEECKKKCCGAGGAITLTRDCHPPNKCKSYKVKKEEPDCTKVCSKDLECSGVMCKISLLVLLFGAFMNWLLK